MYPLPSRFVLGTRAVNCLASTALAIANCGPHRGTDKQDCPATHRVQHLQLATSQQTPFASISAAALTNCVQWLHVLIGIQQPPPNTLLHASRMQWSIDTLSLMHTHTRRTRNHWKPWERHSTALPHPQQSWKMQITNMCRTGCTNPSNTWSCRRGRNMSQGPWHLSMPPNTPDLCNDPTQFPFLPRL